MRHNFVLFMTDPPPPPSIKRKLSMLGKIIVLSFSFELNLSLLIINMFYLHFVS